VGGYPREDEDSFAARYARERLAVLDGDTEAIVELLGGDLSAPHQFVRVAEAMAGWTAMRTFRPGRLAGSHRPTVGRSPSCDLACSRAHTPLGAASYGGAVVKG